MNHICVCVPPIAIGNWMFWKTYRDKEHGYSATYYCRICEKEYVTTAVFVKDLPEYCPYCGARMMDEVSE